MNKARFGPFVFSLLVSVILCCTGCKLDCALLPAQCDWTPDSGPCFAAIEKYFFDSEDQMCKPFIWGGCEGTVPFDSLEECQVCECH
ncbi:MAG: proteinase inhibitor I4 serpin [Flavobacteriales bacterium]|nr:proteinase inhibitor I4 serpin [Flavobacteriales bacterium]